MTNFHGKKAKDQCMKFSQKNFENWRFWKMHFFWVGHFEFFFSKKKFFFCFFPMKISQSLLVSKDGSRFWSSQTWQHFLTQSKHFAPECIVYPEHILVIVPLSSILSGGIKVRTLQVTNFFPLWGSSTMRKVIPMCM